jgi:hypothetical protein
MPASDRTYFFMTISFAAMIASVARVATKANHKILSTSLKRATRAGPEKAESGVDSQAERIMIHHRRRGPLRHRRSILLLALLVRHFLKEGQINQPVELVDIHGVNTILKPVVFDLMALDRFLVLAALVGVAGVKGIAHPIQHLVVELQLPEQFGELLSAVAHVRVRRPNGCLEDLQL